MLTIILWVIITMILIYKKNKSFISNYKNPIYRNKTEFYYAFLLMTLAGFAVTMALSAFISFGPLYEYRPTANFPIKEFRPNVYMERAISGQSECLAVRLFNDQVMGISNTTTINKIEETNPFEATLIIYEQFLINDYIKYFVFPGFAEDVKYAVEVPTTALEPSKDIKYIFYQRGRRK